MAKIVARKLKEADDFAVVTPMAYGQTAHSLDPVKPGASLVSVDNTRKTFPIVPISKADTDPVYIPNITFSGGLYGDDVALATANSTVPIVPNTQVAKAAFPGVPNSVVPSESVASGQALTQINDFTFAKDITAPRGYIGPQDPYSKPAPAAPTLTAIAPNTAAGGSPDLVVVLTGSGFTQWTQVLNGGVQNMTARYVSPTKMTMMMEVSSSVAGLVNVVAVDHGVATPPVVFTFT